jgi:integrase
MGPKEARDAAIKLDADKALASARAGTFEAVVQQYLDRHVKKRGLRSAHEVERLFRVNVLQRWGKKRIADLGRRDVAELLDEIEDASGPGVADSVLAVVRGLLNWYQSRDDDFVSPVVGRMRRRGAVKRGRWLNDDEIRQLWAATENGNAFAGIVRLLLLTGQRKSKVATMRWSDVDLETGVWTIAREAREKGCPSQLTLTKTALDVIGSRPRFAENEFVFAGRGGTCFNAWSQSKARLDEKLNFDQDWRLHDLRRTCRALMSRCSVASEVAELALGHTIKGVQAHYDNPEEYRKRIDQALRLVEAEVGKILQSDRKVIPYRA